MSFSVGNLRNPVSLEPSDFFEVFTLRGDDRIDGSLDEVVVTMESTPQLQEVDVSPESHLNSDITSYLITVLPSSPGD